MRASLKRKQWPIEVSLFSQFTEYVIKKGRPHGTDMGNFQKTKNITWPIILKKRCIKRDYKGIHDRFLRDHVFRGRMFENSRDEEVCRAWDVLAEQDHTYHMSEEEKYFHYKQNWWISLNKSGNDTQPLRKRSDFKKALSTLKTFTPRSWRRPTRAHSLLEVQTMETDIEFFLHLVAMARLLVVFLRIQRKSRKKRQAKACDRTWQPVVLQNFGENLR